MYCLIAFYGMYYSLIEDFLLAIEFNFIWRKKNLSKLKIRNIMAWNEM